MKLAQLTPGDIVRVDDGIPYLAEVVSIEHARVHVKPIILGRPSLAPRTVRPAWLAGWWKRMDQRGDRA